MILSLVSTKWRLYEKIGHFLVLVMGALTLNFAVHAKHNTAFAPIE